MAERKQGPVKPPTIDLTAREAGTGDTTGRRNAEAKPAAEGKPSEATPEITSAESTAPREAPPKPTRPARAAEPAETPSPPNPPPRPAAVARSGPSWGLLGTAVVAGALLGTALTYGLASVVPLPAPAQLDLQPLVSAQADRVATLEERLAAVEAGTLDVRSLVDTAQSGIEGRIDALEAALADVRDAVPTPTDTTAIEGRLRTLTSRVDAIAAGASSADAGAMAENIADLEQDLARLQTELDAAQARSQSAVSGLAALEAEVASLRTDFETAAAEPELPPQPDTAPLALLASNLETAFLTGRPYATELAGLATIAPPVEVPEVLALRAGTGLVPPDELERDFAAAVPVMLAARPAGSDRWEDNAANLLSSLLAIRPAGETEGDAPEAVMSRLEAAMARHDYAGALALFAALPPEMAAAGAAVHDAIAAHAAAGALLDTLRQRTVTP